MFRYLWLDVPGGPAVSTAAAAAGDEISWNFDMVLLAPTEKGPARRSRFAPLALTGVGNSSSVVRAQAQARNLL